MSTPISSDLIIVQRSSTLYKATKTKWDGTSGEVGSSDLVFAARGGTNYKETYGNKANIDGTDLVLVEATATTGGRSVGTKYKCTRCDWDGVNCAATGQNIHSAPYSPPITVHTTSSSGDSNLAFDILNLQVEVGGTSQYGQLYVGQKNTASTAYYGDLPVGVVQVFESNGTTLKASWSFHHTSYVWATTTSTFTMGSTAPTAYSYSTISSSTCSTRRRYCRAIGTSSSYTGANNSISGSYGTNTGSTVGVSSLPSSGTVSQSSGYYYVFGECSGTSTNNGWWMRSSSIYMDDGDYVRIAYLSVGPTSGAGCTAANTMQLFFG
jgi:hypothetical protein